MARWKFEPRTRPNVPGTNEDQTAGIMHKVRDSLLDLLVFIGLAIVYTVEAIVQYFIPVRYKVKSVVGDIVLITGGGGGLGRLLAERFSKLGATIVVWDINRKAVDETVELVKASGGTAYGYVCDITKNQEVYATAEDVKNKVGRVTILINNAGIVSGKPLLDTPDHLIQRTFDVNIISHFWMTKAFLPDMIAASHGHIVTVASMAGLVGMTKLVDYCASKYAAVGFDEALRLELESNGHHNVNMTSVCPYFIKSTGMFDGVQTRFVPILSATQVADRIVMAVLTNEKRVYLPGYFQILVFLKSIFPWTVGAMVLRTLVHDAHPDKGEGTPIEYQYKPKDKVPESATAALTSNLRDTVASERKP